MAEQRGGGFEEAECKKNVRKIVTRKYGGRRQTKPLT